MDTFIFFLYKRNMPRNEYTSPETINYIILSLCMPKKSEENIIFHEKNGIFFNFFYCNTAKKNVSTQFFLVQIRF